ncbi:hypothetical protein [Sulfurospirillum sp. MES]|uniref:hypothetical protein n=1 Tax=Sulfurospirillum sp. MES TaxID=1565314 RepID=UPI0005437666|nr:hypothetical protein [Sulfurospirillum sp. MES]KHG33176.1 MAG: hypothetical protein OA34_11400 [Sulfurospirillum sp. MES]
MSKLNNDASIYVQKMLDFYKISSLADLSKIINVSPPAITNWRKFDYVNAIRKKCKELGIYETIFEEEASYFQKRLYDKKNPPQLPTIDFMKDIDLGTQMIFSTIYKQLKTEEEKEAFRLYIFNFPLQNLTKEDNSN